MNVCTSRCLGLCVCCVLNVAFVSVCDSVHWCTCICVCLWVGYVCGYVGVAGSGVGQLVCVSSCAYAPVMYM